MRHRTLLTCLVLLAGAAALAQDAALTASDAWISVAPGADVAAAYLTLHNGGTQPVVVRGVGSPRAATAMIHETRLVNGQSTMRAHEQLRIAPGETVRFAPGGLHIMLQLKDATLTPGQQVPLTLQLAGGATLTVTALVRPLGEG